VAVVAHFARAPRRSTHFVSSSSLCHNETFSAAIFRARATDKKEIAGEEK
jgi:hypothetical protein